MLDLRKAVLPSSVEVEGELYSIHTDFRFWINLSIALEENPTQDITFFDYLYVNKKPQNRQAGINALISFLAPKKELPRADGSVSTEKIFDYKLDSRFIFAAFLEQYNIDLFDEKLRLHWHKFLGLLDGLHDTKLNEIMGHRAWKKTGKYDPDKENRRLKEMWEIREEIELTEEEKAEEEAFFSKIK